MRQPNAIRRTREETAYSECTSSEGRALSRARQQPPHDAYQQQATRPWMEETSYSECTSEGRALSHARQQPPHDAYQQQAIRRRTEETAYSECTSEGRALSHARQQPPYDAYQQQAIRRRTEETAYSECTREGRAFSHAGQQPPHDAYQQQAIRRRTEETVYSECTSEGWALSHARQQPPHDAYQQQQPPPPPGQGVEVVSYHQQPPLLPGEGVAVVSYQQQPPPPGESVEVVSYQQPPPRPSPGESVAFVTHQPKPPPLDESVVRRAEIRETYKVLQPVIGEGSFGTVRSCVHRVTRARLVVKSIAVRGHAGTERNRDLARNEIAALSRLQHRHVVCLVDVVWESPYLHIVMERCQGANLFDLTQESNLGEGRIRRIVACLMDALAYLHSKNIVHRDLKAEHLMFVKDNLDSDVKIIDFGVAAIHEPDSPPMTALVGSLRTVAPEVIKRSYDRACDLWSVGVVTFFLLTRQMPFDGHDQGEIFERIGDGEYEFPAWATGGVSATAKHFIDCLLQVDTTRRMPAAITQRHPWLKGQLFHPEVEPPKEGTTVRARRPRRRRALLPSSENGRYFSDDM